jgi:predicted nucleotidyltransferase/HEPN domain-containing protein
MDSQTNQALKVARRFVRALQRSGIELDAAYLYGSYANGAPHEWSDIDIALVSKDLTGGIDDVHKIHTATRTHDSRIESVRFHPRDFQDENPLVWEIKKSGIPLTRTKQFTTPSHILDSRQIVKYWRKAARVKWKHVSSSFAIRRYSYALVFARQYLENVLKAVIVQRTKTHAPYRRSLIELANIAQVNLNEQQRTLLERVEAYTQDKFEDPYADAIRRAHTRRFTTSELKAIKQFGETLLALRPKAKHSNETST